MSKCLKKLSVVMFVLLASIVFLSTSVFAALTGPYVNAPGTFIYNDVSNELSITMGTIGAVQYKDNTGAYFPCCGPFSDFMFGGTWTISGLYNGDGAGENWDFVPSANNPADFTLYDSLGNQRLTAEIWNFEVVQNGSLFEVNVGFDQYNVKNIVFDPNSPESRFITEADSFHSEPWEPMGNLYMKFNFSDPGTHDFTESASGSLSSTFSVVPEPVSSLLFLVGASALAFRRSMRNRLK